MLLLAVDRLSEAETLFNMDAGKYADQVNLQILRENLPRLKTAPDKSGREMVRKDLEKELLQVQMELANLRLQRVLKNKK